MTVDTPLAAGLQCLVHFNRALLCGTTHGKLHGHNRQTQQNQESQIDQHENSAAILSGDVGEFPNIADADGTAGTEENEAKAAS